MTNAPCIEQSVNKVVPIQTVWRATMIIWNINTVPEGIQGLLPLFQGA